MPALSVRVGVCLTVRSEILIWKGETSMTISDFTGAFIVAGVAVLIYLVDFIVRRRRKK